MPLGLQHGKLLFRGDGVGLCGREAGLGLQEIGVVLLRLLDGDRAALDETSVALVLLLREGEYGLRLDYLLVGFIDAGLLGRDLRVDIGDVGLRLVDLRFGLIEPAPGSRSCRG